MEQLLEGRLEGLSCLVGNTPMLVIDFTFKGKARTIFAKAEFLNMTGSIKDRMALHILRRAYERELLKPGTPIFEATSGNTGISFAALGRALAHPVTILMPDWMSEERKTLIRSFGAEIKLVTREEGGFLGSIRLAEQMAKETENGFLPRQFSNEDNVEAHYLTTGPEIWWQLRFRALKPDAFVAGIGTGGTMMGVGNYLRKMHESIKIHPLEPANSPTLSAGHKVGKHRIQGISDEFIPAIMELDRLDRIVSVDDGDAIIMAQRLSSELGLGVGISSGANFLGALTILNEMSDDAVVVTVFPDSNKKYLSTDLFKEEPVKDDFMTPHVRLGSVKAFKRVCFTCCDPEYCSISIGKELLDETMLPHCPRRDGSCAH